MSDLDNGPAFRRLTAALEDDPAKRKKKKEAERNALSDSLDKYTGVMRAAANRGDVKTARDATGKYQKFSDKYTSDAIAEQLEQARANVDSAKKYGAHEAAIRGKLQGGGGMSYGAEADDTGAVMSVARKRAQENAAKEQADLKRAMAKP